MNSPGAPVTVESDLCSEVVIIKMTKAQKRFIERQARAEYRTMANYVRTLIVDRMGQ
jgi:hypothetical protein